MAGKNKEDQSIDQYTYPEKKRLNNPPVGLVTPGTDKDAPKKKYQYDPHLDPQLVWAGKAEHTSFEVDTVSLHVHERIDPLTIIAGVRKQANRQEEEYYQMSLFEKLENYRPLREAVDFYKHDQDWANRLIAGDSLLVMNSLLEKEGMAGKVQMIYIDPPYGVKYGSNFQPFVNKRDVKDGKDEDLTAEPEMIRAFRDTWELGIHSYLTYLRDRLLLARELLTESGSCFVQISDENVHLVRCLMDEVFGVGNFISMITFQKTGGIASNNLGSTVDYLLWYAKDKNSVKYRQLYLTRNVGDTSLDRYDMVLLSNGQTRRLTNKEIKNNVLPEDAKRYQLAPLYSEGSTKNVDQVFYFEGKAYLPRKDTHWKTTIDGLRRLAEANRIEVMGSVIRYRRFLDDFPVIPLTDRWESTQTGTLRTYVVQTSPLVIQRCLLMTTDPGDLVFDPTCGSGTTAYVAEQWGRRWITCDTSRVAVALAKQRLMTAVFDYYELAYPKEGVSSGFKYKTVPHITLKSIANNEPPAQEILYDQPLVDRKKRRVTGPFTVEAVPAPAVKSLDDIEAPPEADNSIARSGETLRQAEWRDELLKTGIRGRGGQIIEFFRLEPLPGTTWLHADGETKEEQPKRAVVSFGPEHAPLEQRQVALAIEEAQNLIPRPQLIVFASFQFDPEAAKDIDELKWPGVTLLKAQMNADLLTADLKKKRSSNQSFWLIGQPDVVLRRDKKGKYTVEVLGFDYYNTRTGQIESGDTAKIAMWMLDTDYDGRSLFPQQVFFPMAGDKEGWGKLAKNLKAEIEEELIEKFWGTVSLPFSPGVHRRVAIKIIDDRGIESLKILEVR
ncbi:site-specific DNA-methyltransferase [Pelotomaculum propionicicum]|uniref:Modification methylase DpnIIB n=1 Tax=Pelotomaculum propionicicum TaxID=258475 RepID=A0A4Y7RKX7_9FIRM|nr:site-specific DNA-methyltransferase [Pelotomaculum propionicicum]TEB09342.1 Modification methylase DpnIIB [Pelotomaculum propionicicum]